MAGLVDLGVGGILPVDFMSATESPGIGGVLRAALKVVDLANVQCQGEKRQ